MSASKHEAAEGQPAWDVATLFPPQGQWSEADYLALHTSHLVELSDGHLEVLPMPSEFHQLVALFLYRQLWEYVTSHQLGLVLAAPLPVRLWEGKIREPDVVCLLAAHVDRRGEQYWSGADLVMEVVSPDDPSRDLVRKRADYAQAGIPEYWIVDPRDRTITVLKLDVATGEYVEACRAADGEVAKSLLLDGFAISVTDTFSQP